MTVLERMEEFQEQLEEARRLEDAAILRVVSEALSHYGLTHLVKEVEGIADRLDPLGNWRREVERDDREDIAAERELEDAS